MSFRRRPREATTARPGVTDVAAGAVRVVSTGILGFDVLLGGGAALGRVTLIIEDGHTALHAHVLAAFAANALQNEHALAVALPNAPADELLDSIESHPAPVPRERPRDAPQLSIAWRYAPRASNTPSALVPGFREPAGVAATPSRKRLSALGFPNVDVRELLANVRAHCKRAQQDGVPARAVIASLGALWEWQSVDLHEALTQLRGIAKDTNAALLVTVPKSTKVAHAALGADAVVRMSALAHQVGPRAPAGVALLEKAPHVAPGVWLGRRGDAYHYRATRRGVAFELATLEPEDGDGNDESACSNASAL